MFLIEDNNFLEEKHKKHIDEIILSDKFPWYNINASITKDYKHFTSVKPFLSHCILERKETRLEDIYKSNQNKFSLSVLDAFCSKHKIKVNEVFRMDINLTYNNGFEKCDTHEDHEFEHKQLLVYLNDCDKTLCTVIEDEGKKIKIEPVKFKGVCFESKPHYHFFPKQGIRVVLVITFDGNIY
jgi:hypothetical protein|tara:strand:+ start:810 stop:1358 length:549 start_codon:yes stop_codon:yes gene_type:complete